MPTDVEELLRGANLRVTRPRVAVLHALHHSPHADTGTVIEQVRTRLALVEEARAELKAALAAIEEKANVPRRVMRVTDRTVVKARAFTRKNPTAATAAVVAGAVAIGSIVWAAVRLYTR